MENKEDNEIQNLKDSYSKKEISFGLPKYDTMACEFEIEKVAEKETEFLLREIRRTMVEKISAYIHLLETIINPASGSLLIFSILKNLNEGDKHEIKEIYKKLAKIQIGSIKLDTVYNELSESEFIKKTYEEWIVIKEVLFKIFERFEKDFDINNSSASNCYFG